MYATVGTTVPDGGTWAFEPKYDGIRVLAFATARRSALVTRNGKDKALQFPEIVRALSALATSRGHPVVLDGEIVALDGPNGRPARFQQLQSRMHVKDTAIIERHEKSAPVAFIAFDLLRDGDRTLLKEPWRERRLQLESLLTRTADPIRLGDSTFARGDDLLAQARREGWEGIIAKRADATYRPGARSGDWLKLKIEFRQEFVVGGFTEPRNTREHLGALLLGYFDDEGRFIYVGHTGGGFTREGLRAMRKRLDPLERSTSPFVEAPRTNEPAHWVTPRVVVEVKFSEWTSDGRLRQPIFLGVRDDKAAQDVGREDTSMQKKATPATGRGTKRTAASKRTTSPTRRSTSTSAPSARAPRPASLLSQLTRIERETGDGTLRFDDGTELSVTSLDKPFWKKEGITKGALMRYYTRVAPALLPALADRPLALKRYPNGVAGHSFFQQNAGDHVPEGVRTAQVETEDEGKQPRLIGGDLPTLLYTVQLGTIAVNAWHSRLGALDWPDYSILDLDPSPRAPFSRVIQVARWVRDELELLGLHGALKTSGSRGLHIVIPLPRRTTYDTSAALAERVATQVARAHPKEATVARSIGDRPPGSVYVDHMQNARGKTLASVFSVRARPGATVSTPVSWRQLGDDFDPHALDLTSVPGRFKRVAAIWERDMSDANDAAAVRAAAKGK
ncbi:MAG TPA: DNA ligase D [Gemmatimonadaceae bacterium]|nr:DNA ligase D [Gemmatimonadaceae bacterium]